MRGVLAAATRGRCWLKQVLLLAAPRLLVWGRNARQVWICSSPQSLMAGARGIRAVHPPSFSHPRAEFPISLHIQFSLHKLSRQGHRTALRLCLHYLRTLIHHAAVDDRGPSHKALHVPAHS